MKQIILLLSFSLFGCLLFGQGEKAIDASKSSIVWTGKKVTGSHTGNINISEGVLKFDNGRLSGGTFTIDMNSITNTDLSEKMQGRLVGHLKSDDFFGVATYPTATVNITEIAPGDGGFNVTADLTIKETTAPVTFLAKMTDTGATANISVDRTIYDVRYGSGKFFDGLGDKMIYDNFDLIVELAF